MESIIDQILFLQNVSIFKDLTVEELGKIASISNILEYDENEYLFKEGDYGYNAYIVISGSVEIYRVLKNKEKSIISIMRKGNYFGEMSLFDGFPRSASARTLETSIIMSYKKEDMDKVIGEYPSIAMRIIKVMSRRIRENGLKIQRYEQILSEFRSFSKRIDKIIDVEMEEND